MPAGQPVQAVVPPAPPAEYEPAAQSVQPPAPVPVDAANVPCGQGVQAVAPAIGAKKPAEHATQLAARLWPVKDEDVPAGQGTGAAPAGQYLRVQPGGGGGGG